MKGNRKWSDILDEVNLVEGFMLQGFTTPQALLRVGAIKALALKREQLSAYISAVQRRWAKQLDRETVTVRRAQVLQQLHQNLRSAYAVLAELQQSTDDGNYAERNKTIANITRILHEIGTVEGLHERTLRIGGDREGIPVGVRQEQEVGVLESMVANGLLSAADAARLDAALIAAALHTPGQHEGRIMIDAAPNREG